MNIGLGLGQVSMGSGGGGGFSTDNIAPSRPQLETPGVSQANYDQEYHITQGTFDVILPTNPIIQAVDTADADKIIYDDSSVTGISQHLFRFAGQLGGYYDKSDGNYYDIDGVLSDRDTEFKTNSGDRFTGLHLRKDVIGCFSSNKRLQTLQILVC